MTATILERFREETAAQHRQMESSAYAKAIMDQTLTLDEYKVYLERFYGFLKPLEESISSRGAHEKLEIDMTARLKAPLTEQDLQVLGIGSQQLSDLPLCETLPDISTKARLLGCLYVLEGSTLGGQIITKQLVKTLPISAESGARYFYGYGPETRIKWNEYCQYLLHSDMSEEECGQAVQTAKDTFLLLDRWLNAAPAPRG